MKVQLLTDKQKFSLQEQPDLIPGPHDYIVGVESFGINFADVMAAAGLYQDMPPIPCVLGYDVMGRVTAVGSEANTDWMGKKVVAFTRFGGYASQACVPESSLLEIPETAGGEATALATQYCTAYYASHVITRVMPGDFVLVHAAAGGVGQALMELLTGSADAEPEKIFGVVGSDEKIEKWASLGRKNLINRKKQRWQDILPKKSLDVIFDSVGGRSVKDGIRWLRPGGRMVSYGAAIRQRDTGGFIKDLRMMIGFGLYHPVPLLMQSKALIGVNMLRVADNRPDILGHCLQQVGKKFAAGEIRIPFSQGFPADEISAAHAFIKSGRSAGKIFCNW